MEVKNSESYNLNQPNCNRIQNNANDLKNNKARNFYSSNRYEGNERTIIMYLAGIFFLILLIISIFIPNAHISQIILFICTITCVYVGIFFTRGTKSLSN